MEANFGTYKSRLKQLIADGVLLKSAMQNEQYPEMVEAHFTNELTRLQEIRSNLTCISAAYQPWYSQAKELICLLLPSRLNDFTASYETPKGRKELTRENYVIEDYLKGIVITAGFDQKIVVGPTDAIPQFQLQMDILSVVSSRFEPALFDLKRQLQAVEQLPNQLLDEAFVEEKYRTYLRNIEGVIEHSYYHLGQVSLIKKLIMEREAR